MLYLQHFTHIIISYSTKSPPDVVHFVSAENSLEAASTPETKFNASSQRTEGMTEIHEGIVKDAVINKSWVMLPMNECSFLFICIELVMMIWFLSVIYAYHIHIHLDISTSPPHK